jgi:hypothetical protein
MGCKVGLGITHLFSEKDGSGQGQVLPAITTTSVACDIGPGVNTLRAQLIFLSKPNFCNLFEFSATKFTEKEISSTP